MDEQQIAESAMRKLGLTAGQVNSLAAVGHHAEHAGGGTDGWTGEHVAAELAARFGLDVAEPLGMQLAAGGVLTVEEGEWLDDS